MKYLILLTLFITNTYAQVSIKDCEQAGENFGSQRAVPVTIPKSCMQIVYNSKKNFNSDKSDTIEVVGFKNLLYTLIEGKEHITSGEKSKLTNIIAVKLNLNDKKTYVLNQNKNQFSIYSYFYSSGGNTVPARKLVTNDIEGATNFKIDNDNKMLYVISKTNSWIKVFNRDADPDGPRVENKTTRLNMISGANTQLNLPVDLALTKKEIFILDNDRVLVYDLNELGDLQPTRVIAGNKTTMNQSKMISIDIENKKIIILNKNGNELIFPIDAYGNIPPQ